MTRARALVLTGILGAIGAVALGLLVAYSANSEAIANGVSIAGVEVGGLDPAEARELLGERLEAPPHRLLRVRAGGQSFTLTGDRIALEVDLDATVREAMEASEAGALERLWREVSGRGVDRDLDVRYGHSREGLAGFVDEVAGELERAPRDARVEPSPGGIEVVPGRAGIVLKGETLRAAIRRELADPLDGGSVRAELVRTEPEVTREELPERYPAFLTVDRSAFKLRFYEDLRLVETYTVGVGQAGFETPAGLYHIENKAVNPSWYVPDKGWAGELAGQVIPPGPDNPIKARWMGFWDGSGVHGTDDVASLGTAASHGCIRMSIPEVTELYDRVPVETPIYIG